MARIKELRPQYMQNDIGGKIVGLMYRQNIKQSDLAQELKITQPAMSYKLKKNAFTYGDLIKIFNLLGLPDSEILELMKVR